MCGINMNLGEGYCLRAGKPSLPWFGISHLSENNKPLRGKEAAQQRLLTMCQTTLINSVVMGFIFPRDGKKIKFGALIIFFSDKNSTVQGYLITSWLVGEAAHSSLQHKQTPQPLLFNPEASLARLLGKVPCPLFCMIHFSAGNTRILLLVS